MKEVIRENVWETNSSTSHSLIILPEKTYDEWEEGEKYIYSGCRWFENALKKKFIPEDKMPKVDTLYTKDEVMEFVKLNGYMENTENMDEDEYEDCWRESTSENGFYTFGGWNGDDGYSLEEDTYTYTSEHGDKIVIRAKYGWDG